MNQDALPTAVDIEHARHRLGNSVLQTPCVSAPDLSSDLDQPLWLKLESLQVTGSFKARGALNWVLTASAAELARGLVTVSAGNHALALAWAARQRSVPVTVVMPEGSSPLKVEGTRALGAEVVLKGDIHAAVAHCHALRDEDGLTLVHPYNDPRVMAGQGTVGLELTRQQPSLQRVLCPIGGGGLISGIGLALKAHNPDIELIGVEPDGAATMLNAWQQEDAGASLASVSTWAASLAPAVVGENTYAVSRRVVDRIVTVDEAAIREATHRLLTRGHVYVEPGASVGLAALVSERVEIAPERSTALVITGANLDPDQVGECLPP